MFNTMKIGGIYCPCPVCGNEEISFGPPDASGGERYRIDAVYCDSCGTVFEVSQWTEQGGMRYGRLERYDD